MKKNSVLRILFYGGVVGILCLTSLFSYANFDDNDHELAIAEKRYQDALDILNKKDEEKRTIPENDLIKGLDVVMDVNALEWPKNSMAMKEDDVDPEIIKKVNKYFNASIKNYLGGREEISRQILIKSNDCS